MRKILLIILLTLSCALLVMLFNRLFNDTNIEDNQQNAIDDNEIITDEIEDNIINTNPPQIADKMELDTDNLESMYILANKNNSLPQDYVPSDLVIPNVLANKSELYLKSEAASALEAMFEAAKNDGINLVLGSAYRSYNYQKQLYDNYVARDGEQAANRYSAKPGQSEHQTGLSVDISDYSGENFLMTNFQNTAEGQWLNDNAHLYGFILRYPQGKESITGYMFEPWHFRYLTKDVAMELYNQNLTYEEYLEME